VVDPWPGYLVGGSHPGATYWQDIQGDYRTNEIAIQLEQRPHLCAGAFVEAPASEILLLIGPRLLVERVVPNALDCLPGVAASVSERRHFHSLTLVATVRSSRSYNKSTPIFS